MENMITPSMFPSDIENPEKSKPLTIIERREMPEPFPSPGTQLSAIIESSIRLAMVRMKLK